MNFADTTKLNDQNRANFLGSQKNQNSILLVKVSLKRREQGFESSWCLLTSFNDIFLRLVLARNAINEKSPG